MNLHIHSAGCLSPQTAWGQPLPDQWVVPQGTRLPLAEPDYGKVLDPRMLRRMSRVIKFGAAAAMDAMSRSDNKMPDAIIVGTAYGCLQDTETFLSKMTEQGEQLLTPTAFIQSTHNTVGAQVALMLGCHGYNNTYVHRGHSFESALVDAALLIDEGHGMVLAGGVDELTETSLHLLRRFGVHTHEGPGAPRGVTAGEGAAFFTLSAKPAPGTLARLTGVKMLRDAGPEKIAEACGALLRSSGTDSKDIDLLLHGGHVGQASGIAAARLGELLPSADAIAYKRYSGDHPSASAFALWMAAGLLAKGRMPADIEGAHADRPLKKAIVFNSWLDRYTSLFLVEHA